MGPSIKAQGIVGQHRFSGGTFELHIDEIEFFAGERVYAIGRNGSGKSTLARLLSGEMVGSVKWVGPGLQGATQPHVALLRQDPMENLAPTVSVRDNLLARMRPQNLRERLFPRVLYNRLETQFPAASDLLGSREMVEVGKLSGGQRQLLALAAVAAENHEVLILDEYYSGLDATILPRVDNLVSDLQGHGVSILVISHDLEEVAQRAAVVYVIEGGKVKERLDRGQEGFSPTDLHKALGG